MSECEDSAYVGLDVHTESMAVAIARPGRAGPGRSGRERFPTAGPPSGAASNA